MADMLNSTVKSRLRSLKMLLKLRLLCEGAGWLAASAGAAIVIMFLLDYSLHLDDRPLRLGMLVLACAALAAVVWRTVIGPLSVPLGPEDMALLVERKFAVLEDRLISALQLEGPSAAISGASAAMIRATASEANRLLGDISFRGIVDARRLWKVWSAGLAAALIVGGMWIAFPGIMSLWFQRDILLRNVDWPQETYLSVFCIDNRDRAVPLFEVDGGGTVLNHRAVVKVVRGGRVRLFVETAENCRVPSEVTIHATYPSVGETIEVVEQADPDTAKAILDAMPSARAGKAADRTFYHKEFSAVSEPFVFYVSGGDDRRDGRRPHQVVLVESPALSRLHFEVESPPYMQRAKPVGMDASHGVISIPLGGMLHLRGEATKPLLKGMILIDGVEAGHLDITGAGDRNTVTGRCRIPGTWDRDAAVLSFRLTDTDGYSNRRGESFHLEFRKDPSPAVTLRSRGVGESVCPQARIPLAAAARDDLAVSRVTFRGTRVSSSAGGDGDRKIQPFAVGSGSEPPGGGLVPFYEATEIYDLKSLELPVGSELEFRAVAFDNLPESFGGPNRAESSGLRFKVVSREQLLAGLAARQREVRIAFFKAMGSQAGASGRITDAAADLRTGGAMADAARRMRTVAATERAIAGESLAAAETLESVARELENNRLRSPEEAADMMARVVRPLGSLAAELRKLQRQVEESAACDDRQKALDALDRIAARQSELYALMDEILARMKKLENRLEISRRLEEIWKISIDIQRNLKGRLKEEAGSLFDPVNKDGGSGEGEEEDEEEHTGEVR